jgi:hypothetical protein
LRGETGARGATGATGPTGPAGAGINFNRDEVRFGQLTLAPGQSVFSDTLDNGFGDFTPITLAVLPTDDILGRLQDIAPNEPFGRFGLALTAYHLDGGTFRISATNICQTALNFADLRVIWWTFLG